MAGGCASKRQPLRGGLRLTDLGLLALEEGKVPLAVARLNEALALAKVLGDQAREGDILGSLGLAVLEANQPEQACQYLEQALILVRAVGDRFAEKLILERLGAAQAGHGNMPATLGLLDEALTLARTLGDRQHEADSLWHLAIRRAELGQREQSLAYGQAAVHLWQTLGKPQARIYAEHLRQYQQGEADAVRREAPGKIVGGTGDNGHGGQSLPGAMPATASVGPGYLQMAVSAAKALIRFVGTGLKTVTTEISQERLRRCAACSYHTGLRCRVCGCFTHLKTRLPHEECPRGEWPAVPPPDR